MRAPIKATVLMAVLVLFSFGLAQGQAVFVNMAEVGGLTAAGEIPSGGGTLTIPVRFTNANDARTAISNGYYFHSADVSVGGITVLWNASYPWYDILAFMLGCFPPPMGECYPWFDQGHWETAISKELGGFGMAALTGEFGDGLSATFDDVAYTFTLTGVTGPDGSVLTMDTTYWEPGNYWLWSGIGDAVDWGGPYDFQFEGDDPGVAPTFTDVPDLVSTGQVGELFTFDVNADGDPAPGYAVTGPVGMAIDPVTGVLTWTPAADQTGINPVIIVASNGVDPDAQYNFTIGVIPAYEAPLFTDVPADPSDGQVGELFTFDFNVTGYPDPGFSVVGPAGMAIDADGILTWTPTADGTFPATVTANNGIDPEATYAFDINVIPAFEAPLFTDVPADPSDGQVGELFTFDFNVTGYPDPGFSVVGPAGMIIDGDGILTWTPTADGTFGATVTANNGIDPEATYAFDINVIPAFEAPLFTDVPADPSDGQVGELFTFDFNVTGYPDPDFSVVGPAGMAIDADGILTWTPTADGTFGATVTANNGIDPEATYAFDINVIPAFEAPLFTDVPADPSDGQVGELFTFDFNVTGYPDPGFSVVGPAGMAIDADGILTWTPTADGTFGATVTANNGIDPEATYAFNINVIPAYEAPAITTMPPAGPFVEGAAYSYNVDATGYPAPLFSLSVFPSGMAIDAVTGIITWTCAVGTHDVTVVATNLVDTDEQVYQIVVEAAGAAPFFTAVPADPSDGQVGELFTFDFDAEGDPAPGFSVVGPAGMGIDAVTGVLTWTPTTAGTFPATVTASNGVDPDATYGFDINVIPADVAPVVVEIPDQEVYEGDPFSYNADVEPGCYPPPTFTIAGPAGMIINAVTGDISWDVAVLGDHEVTVTATNSVDSDDEVFTLSVVEKATCEPYTTCWPQPIDLKALYNDRILNVYINCEDTENIVQSSIRVFNIPPYAGVHVEGDSLYTTAFIMRFLGAGGLRPIPSDGYPAGTAEYEVHYTMEDATEKTLVGGFILEVNVGNVTFDDAVNVDDIVFMTEFLFNRGPRCAAHGENLDELMDIDQSGRIDLLDVRALVELVF